MNPTFSEFQFTYGLTRELEGPTLGMGLIDLPRIPTQHQEAEIPADMISMIQDGTTRIAPLFIQYKRSEKMIRSNAGQWKKLKENHGMNLTDGYFRFRPYLGDTNQHNKLVALGQRQPLTYYVAPMFIDHDEYRRYAANAELYEHAAFIQCGNLQYIDDDDHYVAYTPHDTQGVMFSEPTTFPIRSGVEGAFEVDELHNSLATFERLQDEFDTLRTNIVHGFDQEKHEFTEYLDYMDSDATEPVAWMEQQQTFFRNTIGTDLLFFTRNTS